MEDQDPRIRPVERRGDPDDVAVAEQSRIAPDGMKAASLAGAWNLATVRTIV